MLKKFNLLKEELLLEAVDLSTGENVYRAIQRGQIPFVKPKSFFAEKTREEALEFIRKMDKVILPEIKRHTNNENFNSYLMMSLRKADDIEGFNFISTSRTNILLLMDSMKAYFDNINKREVKENPEIKNRFEVYARTKFYTTNDREFEHWANKTFEHKAKVKDEEAEKEIHYDKNGWKVFIPQSFAAAKELTCMGDKKAKWCTGANLARYKDYTDNGKIPLYIIRNESKGLMYQLDFGKVHPNFQDEHNQPIKTEKVLKEIPEHVLSSIKNNNGENLYNLLLGRNVFLPKSKSIEGKKGYTEFKELKELRGEFKKYGYNLIKGSASDEGYAHRAMSSSSESILHSGKYSDGTNTYIYVIKDKNDFGANSCFGLRGKNGKIKRYKKSTIFKLLDNSLHPISITDFLKLDLPKELDKLLNDYIGSGVNLKDENPDKKSESSLKEIYNKDGIKIYPLVNSLKSYLSIPGMSNDKLSSIKKILHFYTSNRGIRLDKDTLVLFTAKEVIFIRKTQGPEITGYSLMDNDRLSAINIFNRVPVYSRKGLLNFLMEIGYFGLNEYKESLGKNFDKVTEVILGVRKEISLGKFSTEKGNFSLKLISGKKVGKEKVVVERDDGVKANVYYRYIKYRDIKDEERKMLESFYESLSKEDNNKMDLLLRKITAYSKRLGYNENKYSLLDDEGEDFGWDR